jgi:hypothetical protein
MVAREPDDDLSIDNDEDDVADDEISDDDDDDVDTTSTNSSIQSISIGSANTDSTSMSNVDDEYSSSDESDGNTTDAIITDDELFYHELFKALINVNKMVSQIRQIVNFVHDHAVVNEFIRQQHNRDQGELVLDVKMRWNSSHLMLERFLAHEDIIKTIVGSPDRFKQNLKTTQLTKLKSLMLTYDDWELVKIVHNILTPFRQATVLLSSRSYPTLGMSHYIIRAIEHFLSANDDDLPFVALIRRSLRLQVGYYLNTNLTSEQKEYSLVSQ